MQQISVKLATAIALSSALLLTACGGSSDSSGDNTAKSKVDTLVGYWKSECDNEYTNVTPNTTIFSDREYFQIVKHGNNELKFAQNIEENFTNNNCSGKGTFEKYELEEGESGVLPKKELDKFTLQGKDKFFVEDKGHKITFTRVQPEDFPVVK